MIVAIGACAGGRPCAGPAPGLRRLRRRCSLCSRRPVAASDATAPAAAAGHAVTPHQPRGRRTGRRTRPCPLRRGVGRRAAAAVPPSESVCVTARLSAASGGQSRGLAAPSHGGTRRREIGCVNPGIIQPRQSSAESAQPGRGSWQSSAQSAEFEPPASRLGWFRPPVHGGRRARRP